MQEQARREVQTALYIYQRIFSLPKNDPRLRRMTDPELLVEIEKDRLYQRLRVGKTIDEVMEAPPEVEEAMSEIENYEGDDDPWEEIFDSIPESKKPAVTDEVSTEEPSG